jgi:hypothetical protein
MLKETIGLYAAAMLLYAAAAALAWHLGGVRGRGLAWLCMVGAALLLGLRSAIPFWVAYSIGLYDFRDGLLTALASILFLVAIAGLAMDRR